MIPPKFDSKAEGVERGRVWCALIRLLSFFFHCSVSPRRNWEIDAGGRVRHLVKNVIPGKNTMFLASAQTQHVPTNDNLPSFFWTREMSTGCLKDMMILAKSGPKDLPFHLF